MQPCIKARKQQTTSLLKKSSSKKKNMLIPYTQRIVPPPIYDITADSIAVSSVSTNTYCSHELEEKEQRQHYAIQKRVEKHKRDHVVKYRCSLRLPPSPEQKFSRPKQSPSLERASKPQPERTSPDRERMSALPSLKEEDEDDDQEDDDDEDDEQSLDSRDDDIRSAASRKSRAAKSCFGRLEHHHRDTSFTRTEKYRDTSKSHYRERPTKSEPLVYSRSYFGKDEERTQQPCERQKGDIEVREEAEASKKSSFDICSTVPLASESWFSASQHHHRQSESKEKVDNSNACKLRLPVKHVAFDELTTCSVSAMSSSVLQVPTEAEKAKVSSSTRAREKQCCKSPIRYDRVKAAIDRVQNTSRRHSSRPIVNANGTLQKKSTGTTAISGRREKAKKLCPENNLRHRRNDPPTRVKASHSNLRLLHPSSRSKSRARQRPKRDPSVAE